MRSALILTVAFMAACTNGKESDGDISVGETVALTDGSTVTSLGDGEYHVVDGLPTPENVIRDFAEAYFIFYPRSVKTLLVRNFLEDRGFREFSVRHFEDGDQEFYAAHEVRGGVQELFLLKVFWYGGSGSISVKMIPCRGGEGITYTTSLAAGMGKDEENRWQRLERPVTITETHRPHCERLLGETTAVSTSQ